MITGSLKNKIDAIWQDFYNENMAQVFDIVNQLTTLMFIKMLDDKQSATEAQASVLGIKPRQEELVFKDGEYENYEVINGVKQLKFRIPYADLRWKNFKNLNSLDLARRIKEYVVPFIKDPDNKAIGKFGLYAKKYSFGFDDKERLLQSVVDKLSDDELNFTKTDLMGDVYEYMCGSGISGQYRTPRHLESVHKGGIVHAVDLCSGRNSGDPQTAEISLLLSASDIGIIARFHNCFFSSFKRLGLCAKITLVKL